MFDLYFVINRFWTRVWGSVLKQITRETVSEGNVWASTWEHLAPVFYNG